IETINEGSVGPAQPDRTFDHSFEYHFEIERRAADDLENFGGRGLLLPRLGKFAGKGADLRLQIGKGRSLWRVVVPGLRRAGVLRFRWLTAHSPTPSHLALPLCRRPQPTTSWGSL